MTVRPVGSEIAARVIRDYSMVLVLVVVVGFFALLSDRFLSVTNLLRIVNNAAVTGTLALGMTWVLMVRGIDLSVGAVVTITTVALGVFLVTFPLGTPLALVLALSIGALIGLANGMVIVRLGVPPIIATLGMAAIVQSIAQFTTQGATTSLARFGAVVFVGQGYVGPVPFPAIVLLVLALICHVALTRMQLGTYVRAIGGNPVAARLMGLNVAGYQIGVYVLAGTLAGLAGIVVAGRSAYASSQAGLGLELPAIAAAVLGGTSLFGGSGSMAGTLVGALILSVLFNGLILAGVPFFYQFVVTGTVLILIVALNETIRRRLRK